MARKSSQGSTPNTTAGDAVDACECRSGPIFGTALVNGVNFRGKWLHYADVDGKAMFEGDIVLGSVAEMQAVASDNPVLASVGITGQQFRWPDARIPFEVDPGLANPQRVTDAIAHWQANTAIRFVARTAANAAQFPDFVAFVPGDGCSSHVGRRGGRQPITLGPNCTLGNTIHEIGHAVGLWHEQSREDRDNFVQIVFANIDPAMQHNFNQHIADGDDLGAYDYGSIMHYPATAFSTNGQATIVPRQTLPPGVVMGQRSGLSAGDIAGVRAMYPNAGGGGVTIKEIRKDPITDPITAKEIRKDPIRDPITIKEIRKDPIRDPITIKEVRKDPIRDPITIKEGAFDPGPIQPRPFPSPRSPADGGAVPFVLASQSHYAPADPLQEAALQVQQLAEAHTQAQAQADELAAAYEQAVAVLEQLQSQQGGV